MVNKSIRWPKIQRFQWKIPHGYDLGHSEKPPESFDTSHG